MPFALGAQEPHQSSPSRARQLDKPLLDGLERVGFQLDFGEDGIGLAVQVPDARRRLLFQRRLLRPDRRGQDRAWRSSPTSTASPPTARGCAVGERMPPI